MSSGKNELHSEEKKAQLSEEKEVYIYADVDVDRAYSEILNKSKRIRGYLQEHNLSLDFTEKMRNYKNFRICFDFEIQKYIHHKELTSDLRLIKKNVFNGLQEFILQRFQLYLEEDRLHRDYKGKVDQIERKFVRRFEELMNEAKKH